MAFRVGIVGCGNISATHAAVLHQLEDTRLVACADPLPERAEALAEKYSCRAYACLEEMCAKEKLDAVHLCVPHFLHAPLTLQAAEAGLAVLCEKPPVISREQWFQMEEAAKKQQIAFCFQNRYNENICVAEKIMKEGTLGRCLGARAFVTWHRTEPYYSESGWRGKWATEGGGALINQTIHTLDLLIQLLGKPELVESHMVNHHLRGVIEVEDTVEAYLLCQERPVLFYASTAYAADAPVLIELQMEKGVLRMEKNGLEIRTSAGVQRHECAGPECLGKEYWGNGHMRCIADFYESLKQGKPLRNGLNSVRNTVEVMLQMYEQYGRKQR